MTMELNGASIPPGAEGFRSANVQRSAAELSNQAVQPPPILISETRGANEPAGRNRQSEARYNGYQRLSRMSEGEMEHLVSEVNSHLKLRNLELNYKRHEGTNQYFLTIYNRDTKEVVREVPPEWSLDMLARVWEMTGIFVNEQG